MKARREPTPEFRRYALEDGWEALVGKTDADNDLLTFRVARPGDWWLHVAHVPGSHVILRHSDGGAPPSGVLKAAAAVAARHSKARAAGVVPVHCTEVRHVGKPRGAKPGSVVIRREKTIKVRPAES